MIDGTSHSSFFVGRLYFYKEDGDAKNQTETFSVLEAW